MLRVLLSKYRHSAGRLIVLMTALVLGMLFFNMSAQLYLQSLQSVQVIEGTHRPPCHNEQECDGFSSAADGDYCGCCCASL